MKLLTLTQTSPEPVTNHGSTIDSEKKRKIAVKEKKSCASCNGKCNRNPPYVIDVTRALRGITYNQVALCPFGQRRLNAATAHIPARFIGKTFGDYETTADNAEAVKIARWYTATKPTKGLYLYGGTGTGKTLLASIIAQEFDGAQFVNLPELMDDLKATFDTGGTELLLNRYAKCKLLILDDIGAGNVTPYQQGVLYRLVNDRYNADKPIIATSNDTLDTIAKTFGRRITSRLSEMTIQTTLGFNDRRK